MEDHKNDSKKQEWLTLVWRWVQPCFIAVTPVGGATASVIAAVVGQGESDSKFIALNDHFTLGMGCFEPEISFQQPWQGVVVYFLGLGRGS